MKKNNFLKKMLAFVLVLVMLSPIMGNLEMNASEVRAADTTESSEMLSIKCQITNGVVTDTSIDKYRNHYVMRFVSSVDSLNYKEVGFQISYMENGKTVTKTNKTKTVFKRIESTTGSTETERETYDFSPKVISTDSEYFITAKWPVAPADVAVDYTVRAFARTTEGTVYGPARCVSVEDGFEENNRINFTVDTKLDDQVSYSVTYEDISGKTVTIEPENVRVIHSEEGCSSIRLLNAETALKSVTKISIKNGSEVVDTALYRNLYTEYDKTNANTVDTSWYEEYLSEDSSETEFTIATNADLYGLAHLANSGDSNNVKQNFSGKKIYLVSDIKLNDETLNTDSTDTNHYKQWYTYNNAGEKVYKETPTNSWTPIGKNKAFCGEFYGQMHTISGVFCTDNSQNTGLFAWAYTNSQINNLKLTNSYFANTYTAKNVNIGSVAGRVDSASFSGVYSDAIVEGAQSYIGGLVGMANISITMDQCWYDGRVTSKVTTSKYQGTGGLVGDLYAGTLTMTNCLNTGTVDASLYTANAAPCAGGLVGWMTKGTTNISNSFNAGNIKVSDAATTGYGFIVGYKSAGTINMSKDNVYSITGEWTEDVISKSMYTTQLTQSSEDALKGQSLKNFDFDTIWSAVPNHTPVLKALKTVIIDDSWYSEEKDTFVLYDKADLYGLAVLSQTENFVGKTIRLGNDIEINTGDYKTWSATNAPKHKWIPIGHKNLPFAGTFDGGLHTISGIYLNATSDNSGLFAATSGVSTIKNLKLKDSYLTSTAANLGSIAGQGRGVFDTVYSSAVVRGSGQRLGGLVGMGFGTDLVMQYCWFDGTVTNTGNRETSADADCRGTGSLIGVLYDGSKAVVKNCLNSGTVDVTAYTFNQNYADSSKPINVAPFAGGFVGYVKQPKGYTTTLAIEKCLNTGNVSVSEVATGCYGMMVGYKEGTVTRANNYSITPDNWKDAYAGYFTAVTKEEITGDTAKTKLSKYDFVNTWNVEETPVLNFVLTNEVNDSRWYDADATEYVLYDKGDLYGFASLSQNNNFVNKTVKLGRNIVVNEGSATKWGTNAPNNNWTITIGSASKPFAGTFDGQGYSISGIYLLNTASNRKGLFGVTAAGSVISNLKLENSYFESSKDGLGSVAGQVRGILQNIYSDAIVKSSNKWVGGLTGSVYGTDVEIKNCWFDGTVTNVTNNQKATGGLVGVALASTNLTMTDCLNEGVVNFEEYSHNQGTEENPNVSPIAGGLLGWIEAASGETPAADVQISRCLNVGELQYNKQKVTAGYGPIVGWNAGKALINDCYATRESCADIGQSKVNANSITQIADADIKGSDAITALPLLDWTNNWEIRENDFPAVKFAASESASANDLQKMIASNVKLSAVTGTGIELPAPDGAIVTLSQGGCSYDGYYYQAFITYKDTTNSQKNNQVRILKYNITTGDAIWSEPLLLNHANDITYNTKRNCLVVCHNAGGANYVSYVNPDTLTLIDADPTTDEIDREDIGFDIYSIDYNARMNRYVVGVSGGQKFRILNEEFEAIYEFGVAEDVKPEFNEKETDYIKYVTQGICSDDNYIYCVLSSPNVIAVYDWFGNYISYIDLDLNDETLECESISVVDNTIYVAAYGSELTDLKTYLYTIKVSDLSIGTNE